MDHLRGAWTGEGPRQGLVDTRGSTSPPVHVAGEIRWYNSVSTGQNMWRPWSTPTNPYWHARLVFIEYWVWYVQEIALVAMVWTIPTDTLGLPKSSREERGGACWGGG